MALSFKGFFMVRDKDDTEWQKVKKKVIKRDIHCRLCNILTITEKIYFDKSHPTRKNLDCAHVFPVSTHPLMVYQPDNIYLLCREHHSRIDDFNSPITGKQISINRHFWWWWRVINKSTEKYNKDIDYKSLVSQQLNEKK